MPTKGMDGASRSPFSKLFSDDISCQHWLTPLLPHISGSLFLSPHLSPQRDLSCPVSGVFLQWTVRTCLRIYLPYIGQAPGLQHKEGHCHIAVGKRGFGKTTPGAKPVLLDVRYLLSSARGRKDSGVLQTALSSLKLMRKCVGGKGQQKFLFSQLPNHTNLTKTEVFPLK